MIADGVRD